MEPKCKSAPLNNPMANNKLSAERGNFTNFTNLQNNTRWSTYEQMNSASQPRAFSLLESVTNVVVGFGINLFGQLFLYPLVGIHISLGTNLVISVFFTVVSIVRSYGLRRLFNAIHLWNLK